MKPPRPSDNGVPGGPGDKHDVTDERRVSQFCVEVTSDILLNACPVVGLLQRINRSQLCFCWLHCETPDPPPVAPSLPLPCWPWRPRSADRPSRTLSWGSASEVWFGSWQRPMLPYGASVWSAMPSAPRKASLEDTTPELDSKMSGRDLTTTRPSAVPPEWPWHQSLPREETLQGVSLLRVGDQRLGPPVRIARPCATSVPPAIRWKQDCGTWAKIGNKSRLNPPTHQNYASIVTSTSLLVSSNKNRKLQKFEKPCQYCQCLKENSGKKKDNSRPTEHLIYCPGFLQFTMLYKAPNFWNNFVLLATWECIASWTSSKFAALKVWREEQYLRKLWSNHTLQSTYSTPIPV